MSTHLLRDNQLKVDVVLLEGPGLRGELEAKCGNTALYSVIRDTERFHAAVECAHSALAVLNGVQLALMSRKTEEGKKGSSERIFHEI